MKRQFAIAASLAFLGRDTGGALSAMGRANRSYTAEDLEQEASGLSNYGGMSGYTGENDDFLEFAGDQGSFADSIHKGKVYNLSVTNANAAARTLLLCPGLIFGAAGLIADGAFNDVNGAAGLTAAGSPRSIALFNNFIRQFPTMVAGFKVSTSSLGQMEQTLSIVKESPFAEHESKIINVSIHASEANPNTSLITVGEGFYMDSQTKITYQVLGSTQVNFGIVFGASLNPGKALRSKAGRARTVITNQAAKYIGR